MLYRRNSNKKENQNTLWTWHKYVLNYWQIENNKLLGPVQAQPPLWQDVNKILWRRTKPRRRWAIHQRGMPGRQEGTNWGRKPRRTARVLRRFLLSLCSTSLILPSPCQHWVDRFLPSLFFNISQHIALLWLFRRLMSILRIVRTPAPRRFLPSLTIHNMFAMMVSGRWELNFLLSRLSCGPGHWAGHCAGQVVKFFNRMGEGTIGPIYWRQQRKHWDAQGLLRWWWRAGPARRARPASPSKLPPQSCLFQTLSKGASYLTSCSGGRTRGWWWPDTGRARPAFPCEHLLLKQSCLFQTLSKGASYLISFSGGRTTGWCSPHACWEHPGLLESFQFVIRQKKECARQTN